MFIKDIAHYLLPHDGAPAAIVPSLQGLRQDGGSVKLHATNSNSKTTVNGIAQGSLSSGDGGGCGGGSAVREPGNPTVLPRSVLERFHFTFLIRDPHKSVPSYYRCTIPPLADATGFDTFMPSEMGYAHLRRLFEYLRAEGLVGPAIAGRQQSASTSAGVNGAVSPPEKDGGGVAICLVEAESLLEQPEVVVRAFCASVGLAFDAAMLDWSDEANQKKAQTAFAKWKGFHNDALNSRGLQGRAAVVRFRKENLPPPSHFNCMFGNILPPLSA